MTLLREARPLTVTDYEIYKKNGISAELIMQEHGMDSDHFSEWLEANKLNGKRFVSSSSPSVDSKALLSIVKNDAEGPFEAFNVMDKQILVNMVELPTEAPSEDFVNLNAVIEEEQLRNAAWLEERHVQDGDTIDKLRAELAEEKARNAKHCDEIVATRRKLTEENAKVINLEAQIKRQDELLVAADRDRKLMFAVMEKAVEQNKQIQVVVEGGEF